jgi:hypothetical protein
MIQLTVGGQQFNVPRQILDKCEYFRGMPHMEDIVVVRSHSGFKTILQYLYDDKYPFPPDYFHELDFYGVDYPKYSIDRDDEVKVYAQGELFCLLAKVLMKGSKHFEEKLSSLYVGKSVHVDCSGKIFRHALGRIYQEDYVIPYQYKYIKELFGLSNIVWKPTTTVKIRNYSKVYNLPYNSVCKSERLKAFLDRHEVMPLLGYNEDAFQNAVEWLITDNTPCLWSNRHLFEWLKLYPATYYRIQYHRCRGDKCTVLIKRLVNEAGRGLASGYDVCAKCRCDLCELPRLPESRHCKKHTCSKGFCLNRVTDGKSYCSDHL